MVNSSQLTPSEYQPAGRLADAGGSPSFMDIPIHRATLLSGELHARLDPVAYPQAGSKLSGTVNGVTYPATPVPLLDALSDRSGISYQGAAAGAVVPQWTQEPALTSDSKGIEDGWGVDIAGHKAYKLVLEIANGNNAPTQFAAVTISAPVDDLSTGLSQIGGANTVNAIYVIRATDAALPANAVLIKRFAAAYVPPAGAHWSITPTLTGDKAGIASGTAVIPGTGSFQIGITYTIPGDAPAPHYFAFSTVTAPVTVDITGLVAVTGQSGTITELWVGPDGNRAHATLVQGF